MNSWAHSPAYLFRPLYPPFWIYIEIFEVQFKQSDCIWEMVDVDAGHRRLGSRDAGETHSPLYKVRFADPCKPNDCNIDALHLFGWTYYVVAVRIMCQRSGLKITLNRAGSTQANAVSTRHTRASGPRLINNPCPLFDEGLSSWLSSLGTPAEEPRELMGDRVRCQRCVKVGRRSCQRSSGKAQPVKTKTIRQVKTRRGGRQCAWVYYC
jgi:hypothetical protein